MLLANSAWDRPVFWRISGNVDFANGHLMNLGTFTVTIREGQSLFKALGHGFECTHLDSPYLATSALLISTAAACSALDRLALSFLAKTVIRKIGMWVPPKT